MNLLVLLLVLTGCRNDNGITTFNNSPEAEITSHTDGEEVLESYTESFQGAVYDSDNNTDELLATWLLDGVVACEAATPLDLGLTLCDIVIPAGDTEVTLQVQDIENAAGSAKISLTVIPTESPDVEILLPTADGVYYTDQKITFEGLVSDGEDGATDLAVQWESDLEGVLTVEAVPNDDGELAGAGYLGEGIHFLTLTAEDSTGKTGSDNVTLTVGPANTSPACSITAPEDGASDEEGTTVVFEAVVSDVDVPTDWLTVTWSSDKDDVIGTSTPNSEGEVTFAYDELSVNTHLVSMTVTDEVGATCTDDILYSVGTPPAITLDAPANGEVFEEGEVVSFQATVSDDEDSPSDLALSWNSDLDGEFSTQGSDSTGTVLLNESGLSLGTHSITTTVTDSDGLFAQAILSLVVNGVPTAPEVALAPDPATTQDDLVVTLTTPSTDPDGDSLSYSYAWSVGGVASGASATSTLSKTNTARGQTWTVEVTPTDGLSDGPAGTDSVTIANGTPVLANVTLSPDPASEGDTLVCSPGTATDPDGDTLTYAYAWSVDGSDPGISASELTGTHFDSGNAVFCSVTPNDGGEDGDAVDSNTVTIDNTAPTIDSVEIDPDPAGTDDTLTCSYSGFNDPDGDADASTMEWKVNGTGAGTDTTLSGAFSSGDTVSCAVTPSDGTTTGTEVSDSLTIDNTAPVLSDVTLSPDPASVNDTLVCTPGTTADTDGSSSFTYTYRWTVNGLDPGETSSQLEGAFDRGDTVLCTVTPSDGIDEGAAVDSNTLTIANSAPVVSTVVIDPDPAFAEDELSCTYTFSDANGDEDNATIAWTIGGTTVGTSSTLSGVFVSGDEVTCTVTAEDGTDTGNSDSATLTVGNTPPVLAEVSLDPDPAYEADTLTCTPGTTTDVDGTIGFGYETAWSVDGVDVGETASTLDGSLFDKGEEVFCTVTPNDGDDDGDAVDSNTVTITNTAPSIDSVTIEPDPATVSDTLFCSYTGYEDSDGDADASTLEWMVNGITIGADGYGAIEGGDTVVCTVTPDDGEDTGTAVSDSVTIGNTAPEVTSVTLSPSTVYTDDTITASVSTDDLDGDSVSVSYAWYVDGDLVGETGSTLDGATYFDKDEEVYVEVTPNDGGDDGVALTSDALWVLNTPPEEAEVSIEEVLSCGAVDLDGTSDYLSMADSDDWNFDTDDFTIELWIYPTVGSRQAIFAFEHDYRIGMDFHYYGTQNVNIWASSTGTSWDLITGDDGNGVGATSLSLDEWHHVAYVKSGTTWMSFVDGELDVSVEVSGSIISSSEDTTFGRWGDDKVPMFNGMLDEIRLSSVARYTSDFTPPTGAFYEDSDTVALWSFDEGSGTTAEDSISGHEAILQGGTSWVEDCADGSSADALVCLVETDATDDDGDEIAYTFDWDVDGTSYGDAKSTIETGDTVPHGDYTGGEEWTCTVTPNDGDEDGDSASASTWINTPPEAPEISITPEDPIEGEDDLVCVIDTDSTDHEGDAISYTFTWRVDGADYPDATDTHETGDTVPATDILPDEQWTCTVTPDDGTEDGPSASASVTVQTCTTLYYLDGDGDGHGDASSSVNACSLPSGYANTDDDCDDSDAAVSPSASETCDTLDNDCDGSIDNDVCPCSVEEYDGHAYMYCASNQNWDDAQSTCASYGYDLATIHSSAESAWIASTFAAFGHDNSWIGFNDQASEGTYVWVSGESVTYTNWAGGEPNNSGNEDCTQIYTDGEWNDQTCSDSLDYVCKTP